MSILMEPAVSTLKVFISYAHEDSEIAVAVSNMLNQTFGKALSEVFLDTRCIPVGAEIGEDIKAALKRADVLVIVSTGALRGAHSWCGFELGFFEACHPEEHSDASLLGKVITICRDGAIPAPVQNRRYIHLLIDDELIGEKEEKLDSLIQIQDEDELVVFLGNLLFETSGEKLSARRDLFDDYKDQVKKFKKIVYREFSKRIRHIRKPQKQLFVRYSNKSVAPENEDLPADAILTSLGSALEVFGIPEDDAILAEVDAKEVPLLDSRGMGSVKAKTLTWDQFRQRVANNPLASHWCCTLAKVVVPPGAPNVNVDNSKVVASHDRAHRFRLILTTSTTYYNGQVEASVYLVEALQRLEYGREDITLLLKGLHIVCRFRFVFLEPRSEFHAINVEKWRPDEAAGLARQLLSEMDLLYTEATDAQLDKPGAWAQFVSLEELRLMGETWEPLGREIRRLCAAAIENAGKEAEETQIIFELKTQLELLVKEMTPHNSTMLRAMSAKLAELAVT